MFFNNFAVFAVHTFFYSPVNSVQVLRSSKLMYNISFVLNCFSMSYFLSRIAEAKQRCYINAQLQSKHYHHSVIVMSDTSSVQVGNKTSTESTA